jgi:hypothetical protein
MNTNMTAQERIMLIDSCCSQIKEKLEKKSGVGVTSFVKYVDWGKKQYSPLFCVLWVDSLASQTDTTNWFIPEGHLWVYRIANAMNLSEYDAHRLIMHSFAGLKYKKSVSCEFDISTREITLVEKHAELVDGEDDHLIPIVEHCRNTYPRIDPEREEPMYPYRKFDYSFYRSLVGATLGSINDLDKYCLHFEDECENAPNVSVKRIIQNERS